MIKYLLLFVFFFLTFQIKAQTVSDVDGNTYNTVAIGTQTWMKENLKTTRYNDGTAIPNVTNTTEWAALTTPAYCWYNNNAAKYKTAYGSLYNWYTVNTGKLCPMSWHVPTDAEWSILTEYLGGESTSGGHLKEIDTTHWIAPNTGADNSSGFTALPAGIRSNDGAFLYVGIHGYFWSSSESSTSNAWSRDLKCSRFNVYRYADKKALGFSVRCIKN